MGVGTWKLSLVFLLEPLVQRAGERLAAPLLVELRARVELAGLVRLFVLQLQVAVEPHVRELAGGRGGADCAAGLLAMTTIAEPAVRRERFDLGECSTGARTGVPELKLAPLRAATRPKDFRASVTVRTFMWR